MWGEWVGGRLPPSHLVWWQPVWLLPPVESALPEQGRERERERERMVEGEEPVYVRMYVYINLVCVTTLYIPSSTRIFSVWRNEFVYNEYGSVIAVSSSSLLIHSSTHLSILTVLLSHHTPLIVLSMCHNTDRGLSTLRRSASDHRSLHTNTFSSSNLASVSAKSLSRELILSAHFFVSLIRVHQRRGKQVISSHNENGI